MKTLDKKRIRDLKKELFLVKKLIEDPIEDHYIYHDIDRMIRLNSMIQYEENLNKIWRN